MISLEKFKYYIESLREAWDFGAELNALWRHYDGDACVWPVIPSDAMIDMLETLTGDETSLIAYWVYDLDFGRRFEDGCITRKGGEHVKLETIEDLYEELCRGEGCDCPSTVYQS